MSIPRRVQLDQAIYISGYMKFHPNSKLVMNPECMCLGERFKHHFKDDAEWFEFYSEVKE